MAALTRTLLGTCLLAASVSAMAEEPLFSTETMASVQDNILAMDVDHDGLVTVFEVRAFIERKHGKHYQATVLDAMESSASGKSCGTPFASIMY